MSSLLGLSSRPPRVPLLQSSGCRISFSPLTVESPSVLRLSNLLQLPNCRPPSVLWLSNLLQSFDCRISFNYPTVDLLQSTGCRISFSPSTVESPSVTQLSYLLQSSGCCIYFSAMSPMVPLPDPDLHVLQGRSFRYYKRSSFIEQQIIPKRSVLPNAIGIL